MFSVNSCTINPAIGTGTAANKQISAALVGSGLERVGILGFNRNTIADGVLYTCAFQVQNGASIGAHSLSNLPSASDPAGHDLPNVGGAPGKVTVTTCTGDCDGDGKITIGEVVKCANLFQGQPPCNLSDPSLSCPVADANGDGVVTIGEVVQCVNGFLDGCP
jgi:hypothetical protein